MRINGRLIAQEIKSELYHEIKLLRQKNIIPHLAVILVGRDKGSSVYVAQKQMLAKKLEIKVSLYRFHSLSQQKLIQLINKLNNNPMVHGIIIQRPIPVAIETSNLNELVDRRKDIDGFHPDSLFDPPVGQAVVRILEYVYQELHHVIQIPIKRFFGFQPQNDTGSVSPVNKSFMDWIKIKKILILGRGETAGKPIAKYFDKKYIKFTIAHSQTRNLKPLCLSSDIIISAVGKPNIVRHDMITDKTILIGVGLHQEDEKLFPDYQQKKISQKVSFFTPVPNGVGPVNVAYLMKNVVEAAKKMINY